MLNANQQEFLRSLLTRARARTATNPKPFQRAWQAVSEDIRSGSGPDERDPALLGGAIDRLIVNRGWDLSVATGQLHAGWPTIVGTEVAVHVTIETFVLDASGQSGVLVLRADSTAWATQIRYLLPSVQTHLDESIGFGRVSEIVVNGPTAPSWKHGLRSVKGRGPRDTYG